MQHRPALAEAAARRAIGFYETKQKSLLRVATADNQYCRREMALEKLARAERLLMSSSDLRWFGQVQALRAERQLTFDNLAEALRTTTNARARLEADEAAAPRELLRLYEVGARI